MIRMVVLAITAALGSWPAFGETPPTPISPEQPPTDMGMPVSPHQEQTERHLEAHGPRFKSLDADRNGLISAQEAKSDQELSRQWNSLDRNGDGQLDPTEFSKYEQGATAP
jgi:Ca2+-binding EF-hand superfamily protein